MAAKRARSRFAGTTGAADNAAGCAHQRDAHRACECCAYSQLGGDRRQQNQGGKGQSCTQNHGAGLWSGLANGQGFALAHVGSREMGG